MKHSYGRFFLTILDSTIALLVMMYFNTYRLEHVFFSQTRLYMAIMMGAAMAIIMLLFMWRMYADPRRNTMILVGAAVVFAVSLWLVRSQTTVRDVAWMKAMIPHHSIAVMTSSRARIADPRVRNLADRIIEAQVREIDEMKGLILDLDR